MAFKLDVNQTRYVIAFQLYYFTFYVILLEAIVHIFGQSRQCRDAGITEMIIKLKPLKSWKNKILQVLFWKCRRVTLKERPVKLMQRGKIAH